MVSDLFFYQVNCVHPAVKVKQAYVGGEHAM